MGAGVLALGRLNQFPEAFEQVVFPLPRRVHDSEAAGGAFAEFEPVGAAVEVVRVVIRGALRLEASGTEELHALLAHLVPPAADNEILRDQVPDARIVSFADVIIRVCVMVRVEHVGPDIDFRVGADLLDDMLKNHFCGLRSLTTAAADFSKYS